MSYLIREKFLEVIFLLLVCTTAFASPDSGSEKTKLVDPNTLKQSPIRHQQLTQSQMRRVKILQKTFSEVDPSSLDKWIEDFKRDANPESEIALWEDIAHAYRAYVAPRKLLRLEAKKDAFEILQIRSMAPEKEVLERATPKVLTKSEVSKVLDGYRGKTQPLTAIGR